MNTITQTITTITTTIKDIIESIIPKETLKNQTKAELLKSFRLLRENNNTDIDNDNIDSIINILEKKSTSYQSNEQIKKQGELVIKIFDEYIVRLDKQDITIENSVSDIENQLDSEISQYNKYNKHNPMLNIFWNDQRKKWRLKSGKIDKYNENLDVLVQQMQNIICPQNQNEIQNLGTINFISYKTKHIIIYNTLEQPLFDIRHIVKLLDLGQEDVKYKEFENQITHYGFKQNEFGGYIKKEFIPEQSMYNLVMSSNSEFSKQFKNNVSKLLCDLRKNNMISINDGNMTLSIEKPNYNKKNISDNSQGNDLMILYKGSCDQSYNNPIYDKLIKDLILKGSKIPLQKYAEQHVLYFFIITIADQTKLNRIFCKIGYTADIIERIKSLRMEYACQIFLIGLKYIKSEQYEKKFHNNIKTNKKHLVYPMQINGKDKDEIYIFDIDLYNEFDAYIENNQIIQTKNCIDASIEQMISDQYYYFLKCLNDLKTNYLYEHLTSIQNINNNCKDIIIHNNTNQSNIYLAELQLIDKNKEREFKLAIKDKEIILRDKDILLKDKEIQLEQLKQSNK